MSFSMVTMTLVEKIILLVVVGSMVTSFLLGVMFFVHGKRRDDD
jgi:hypothetical protein